MDRYIKPAMPRPFSDVFSDFPEILRSRNGDLKTTHASRALLHLFFRQTFLKQLYIHIMVGLLHMLTAWWNIFLFN